MWNDLVSALSDLQWFTHEGWETASYIATVFGIVFAMVSAGIALATYKRTASDAAQAHMHGIFQEYLRLRYDFETYLRDADFKVDDPRVQNLRYDVVASRLYAAEEMWSWVRNRERWSGRRNQEGHAAWLATVLSHVVGEEPPEITAKVLMNFIRCYSLDFLIFVEPYIGDADLTRVVKEQVSRHKRGLPRPAGLREPALSISVSGPGRDWPPREVPRLTLSEPTPGKADLAAGGQAQA